MVVWIAAGVLGFIGVVLFAGGLVRIGRARIAGGVPRALFGAVFLALGLAIGLAGLNLATYQRLTAERAVATVSLEQLGPQVFAAMVSTPDFDAPRAFELRGDLWQMDARILKFQPWANVAGLDSLYRLERLSGRYASVEQERTAERSVYQLSANPGLDLYQLAQANRALGMIDAQYGSGTYVPMANDAIYDVFMTQTGLIARPVNMAARDATDAWR